MFYHIFMAIQGWLLVDHHHSSWHGWNGTGYIHRHPTSKNNSIVWIVKTLNAFIFLKQQHTCIVGSYSSIFHGSLCCGIRFCAGKDNVENLKRKLGWFSFFFFRVRLGWVCKKERTYLLEKQCLIFFSFYKIIEFCFPLH